MVIIKRCLICEKIIWSTLWIGYRQAWIKECDVEYKYPIDGYHNFWYGPRRKEKSVFAHNKCIMEKGEKRKD